MGGSMEEGQGDARSEPANAGVRLEQDAAVSEREKDRSSRRVEHRAGARVSVEVDFDGVHPSVEVRFAPRNTADPVPMNIIGVWEEAVTKGVRHGLAVSRCLPCSVRVTELCGHPEHVRPTLIAAAACQAIWEAIEYQASEAEFAYLVERVQESEGRGPLWLAEF